MADSELELVGELRALGGPGLAKSQAFEVLHEGVRIRVEYTGGSSSSLVLYVPYDEVASEVRGGAGYRGGMGLSAIRPMEIGLRPETDADRMAKQTGMNVEYQTGDEAFDRAVYIDTLTPPEALVHVLEEPVRRAVVELFALELTSIVIDDERRQLVARMVTFASLGPPVPRGARMVDAFARLARALPRVAPLAGVHPAHPLRATNIALAIVGVIAFFGAMPLYFGVIAGDRCPDDMPLSQLAGCLGPAIPGCIVGLVVAVVIGVYASSYTRRWRGRSDSARYGATFAWTVAVIAFSVTATTVSLLFSR